MESIVQRRTFARVVLILAAPMLLIAAAACSGDDDSSSTATETTTAAAPATTAAPVTTAAPETTVVPAPTAAPEPAAAAPIAVTPGLWVEAVLKPPVAVCLFVSEDGMALITPDGSQLDPADAVDTECIGGLEVEFEAVPACPNGKLSIKGTADTETLFEGTSDGTQAVVTDANGTATVTFTDGQSATVVATSSADPGCTYTFENVAPGSMEDLNRDG